MPPDLFQQARGAVGLGCQDRRDLRSLDWRLPDGTENAVHRGKGEERWCGDLDADRPPAAGVVDDETRRPALGSHRSIAGAAKGLAIRRT